MSKADTPSIVTTVSDSPVTYRRPVPVDLPDHVPSPGTPRANAAVTAEMPHGSEEYYTSKIGDRWKHRSVLQQHITYFDRNNDGIVTPLDTFIGFWYLGFNILFSAFAAFVIHLAMSYSTQSGIIPDPRLYIYIKNIHRAKHGSDSETFDTEGRWVPEKFEEVFSKYARSDNSKKTISFMELFELIRSQRNTYDPFGWGAATFEWGTTYLLIGNNGRMKKEDVRGVLDGSLFYKIRDERMMARRAKARGPKKYEQFKEQGQAKELEKLPKEHEKQAGEPEKPSKGPEKQPREHDRQSREHEKQTKDQAKEQEKHGKEQEKHGKEQDKHPKEHEKTKDQSREHHSSKLSEHDDRASVNSRASK